MKTTIKVWLAFLTATCLVGCTSATVGVQPQSVAIEPTSTPTMEPEPTARPAASIRWVKEPTLACDMLEPMQYERPRARNEDGYYDGDFNALRGLVTQDGFSYIGLEDGETEWMGVRHKNYKYGLVDSEGNSIVEPIYSDVMVGYGGQYKLSGVDGEYTLDAAGALVPLEDGEEVYIIGTSTNAQLYWVEDEQKLYWGGAGEAALGEQVSDFDGPVAVNFLTTYPENGWFGDIAEIPFVLTDGKATVSDVQYEAAGAFNCGVVPVKQNGKWGYADTEGNLVIPCEYDATEGYTFPLQSEAMIAYPATENTVVLCKGGQYALYGIDNTEIIPFGAYEALRPVHNGRLWAKQNGKWGVLELTR